jgi:DNA-binding NarL/FixJ family response regulator
MTAVRISVSTHHLLLRDGLLRLLSAEPTFVTVDDAPRIDATHASRTCDIAIIDSQMDGALVHCARLKARNGPSVIFVGVDDDYVWCMEALRAGARGLVSRRVAVETLVRVIHAVRQGGMWVPEHLMVASFSRGAMAGGMTRPDDGIVERLSVREAEVFRHAATGLCNKDLADLLHITEATVKVHLTNIFAKLGLRGRAELAAAYHGILHHPRAVASR